MITPAYSPTATERVLPRMALDFTTASLDSRVTVTRALNTATAVNSSGYIAIVNANLPRFDYDPVTKVCKGLLIEEARTNLLLQTNDFGSVAWAKANVTVATDGLVSPDGTQNADTITSSSAAGYTYPTNTALFAAAGGGTYTFSVYAKAGSVSTFQILLAAAVLYRGTFDLSAKTATTNTANTTASITDAGNGWYRCSVTAASVANNAYTEMQVGRIGSGLTLSLWGAQLEVGAFATSYIPTTTLAVLRNADAVYMTGTNLTDWYNATEGALLVQATTSEVPTTDANVRYAAILYETATFANAIRLERLSGNYRGVKTVAGSSLVASAAWANNLTAKAIFAYKNANSATSFNAGNPGLYAGGVPSGIAYLGIGGTHQGGNVWCGHVQRISYWPQRVTNAETQAFSK